jgi:hypothetical protein
MNTLVWDILVGAQHQSSWNVMTDRLRGPEIDDKLELVDK